MKQELTSLDKQRIPKMLLIAAVVVMGAAVQFWAASQWPENFESDEAIFGLMARHIQQGQFIATVYGTEHLGSIESFIAAGFFTLFGASVTTLRLGPILLFAIFLILQAVFVSRMFGYRPAVVSLLILALPGFHVLSWTYKPVGAYGVFLALGTAVLVLAQLEYKSQLARVLGGVALGLLLGLGIWSNQMMLVYAAALGSVTFLASPEWAAVYARLEKINLRYMQIPLREDLPVAVVGIVGIGVLAFFSSGCDPVWQFEKVQLIARTVLVAIGFSVGLAAIIASRRRIQIGLWAGALALGVGVGYSPMLYDWMVEGNSPVSVIRKSCPTSAVSHLELLVKELLPGMWGIPALQEWPSMSTLAIPAWGAVICLVVAAIMVFVWIHRIELWEFFTLSPLKGRSKPFLIVALLLALPIFLSVVGNNTIDIDSTRHLLVAAQASSIVFALFITDLWRRAPRVGIPILVFWTVFVGLANLNYAREHWPIKFSRFDSDRVAILQSFLQERGASSGFADYWGAFALDFMTSEEITLAPYNGLDRYPAYTRAVKASPVRVFIFPLSNSPGPGSRLEDLIAFLREPNTQSGENGAFPWIIDSLRSQSVLDRRPVADWDVWIVADR